MTDEATALSERTRRLGTVLLALLFVAGWAVLMFVMSPAELVDSLGVEQAYLVVFLLGVIGALASMTTFSTYPAIVTFAVGGMNPIGLVLVTALGLTIGDWLFYSLVTRVKGLLGGKLHDRTLQLERWLDGLPDRRVQVVTFVWVGLLPLANNILTGALAIGGYHFRRIVIPIALGNTVFPSGVAILAIQGVELYA